MVPRSRRALPEHQCRGVGSVRRHGVDPSPRPHALRAPHGSAPDDDGVGRQQGADRGGRARRQPGPRQPFHEAGAAQRSPRGCCTTASPAEVPPLEAGVGERGLCIAGDADRHEGHPHRRARHPDHRRPERRSTSSSTRGRSTGSTRKASRRPSSGGARTRSDCRPTRTSTTAEGPRNQICIARPGMETWVRSWVPAGEIRGMVIRHGEALTISRPPHGVGRRSATRMYRPTVHYAYCPCRRGD